MASRLLLPKQVQRISPAFPRCGGHPATGNHDLRTCATMPNLEEEAETGPEFDSSAVEKMHSLPVDDDRRTNKIAEHGHTLSGPNLNFDKIPLKISPTLVEQVIQRCCTSRQGIPWEKALVFFNWAGQQEGYAHTHEAYNEMLDLLGKMKKFDVAWNLMDEMKNKGNAIITEKTFSVLIKRYLKAGMVKESMDAFNRMEDYGGKPDSVAFANVLGVLCKKGHAKEAEGFFEGLKDRFKTDTVIYTILVYGWCRVGDFSGAMRAFNEMKEAGVQPNVYTYSVLIEGFCRAGKLNPAWDLLREMIGSGCSPNAVTFNALIRAYVKANQREKALEVHNQMKRLKIQPDVVTYNFLIEAHCRDKKLDDAVKVLNQMTSKGVSPNAASFSLLFKRISKMNDVNGAHKLYSRMKELNCVPSAVTYNALIRMFSKMRSTDMVLKLRSEMEESGCKADVNTYRALIGMHYQFGNWNQAYILFKEMTEERRIRPTLETYKMVLDVLRRAGQMKKHEELVDKMDAIGLFKRPL